MAQYIDKTAVVAEIQKLYDKDYLYLPSNIYELKDDLLAIIDELEVKEVDLEKEISNYLASYHLHIKDGGRVVFDNNDSPNFMCDIRHIAKWFFELGLKAQKGE